MDAGRDRPGQPLEVRASERSKALAAQPEPGLPQLGPEPEPAQPSGEVRPVDRRERQQGEARLADQKEPAQGWPETDAQTAPGTQLIP